MKFVLIGAAALAATALVTPVQAQEVVSNPGRCAQYYPNANCENLGAGNPYTNGGYWANGQGRWRQDGWQQGYDDTPRDDWHHRRHHHHYHD
jgi:hypothetical protein